MKLKPCPFCGSDKLELEHLPKFVKCSDCGACGPSVFITANGTINAWNKRQALKEGERG